MVGEEQSLSATHVQSSRLQPELNSGQQLAVLKRNENLCLISYLAGRAD